MNSSTPVLFIEINNKNLSFYASSANEQNNFQIIYKSTIAINFITEGQINDFEKFFNTIKENVYDVEQKLNFTFKETILIINDLDLTFINLAGFKKLNGSQILRENITYILNSLKSIIDEVEADKEILHIFNSKFSLDQKKIENLPIGLFGNFYSHELSFSLIDKNNYKNLKNIFEKCNLKIKKILLKNFVKGASLSDINKNTDTFFNIKIGEEISNIFYFENNSLKFQQDFKFGSNIILQDISKITSLEKSDIEDILKDIDLKDEIFEKDLIEKKYFKNQAYRKIKKKLVYEIALARIKEISEIIFHKNININYYKRSSKVIILEIDRSHSFQSLKSIYESSFLIKRNSDIEIFQNLPIENILETANRLVHFGWKKEAIPVTHYKKSLISRFFDRIFG
jgi:cell division protein FtsA